MHEKSNLSQKFKIFPTIFQYFEHIEEMEWAIEVCKATGMPVAASMCIGPLGDLHGVSSGECAVRMARAGAHVGKQKNYFCQKFVELKGNLFSWR